MNIDGFVSEVEAKGREVVFSGTDNGVVTMSTTVAMTKTDYNRHIQLYNRFALLASMMDVDQKESEENQMLELPSVERRSYRITAEEIGQRTLLRKVRKKENKERQVYLSGHTIYPQSALSCYNRRKTRRS